jgi:hypothetical protein
MHARGMFGDGMGGAKAHNWSEMHLHQQAKHLLDTAADFVFSKSSWWLPLLGVTGTAAILMFSGPMAVPQILTLAATVGTPMPPTSTFGAEMPQMPQAPDDDDDLDA